jgi:type II secretory pathway predicted ATPase ExeA
MYLSHWQLTSRPFDNVVRPAFYYPSEAHQATLLKLRYAIENRRGGALLAGAPGLGKSLLIEVLRRDLPDSYAPVVHVQFAQLTPRELVALLAQELAGPAAAATTDENVCRIEQSLAKNAAAEHHAVLVLDEAHLLRDTAAMETVRLLLNYDRWATVLLVGQPALLPALERMPGLEERLSVKCLLRRFTLEETVSYIHHRMHAAGAADVHRIFEPAALEAVQQLADGNPRRINRLCDMALLIGFAEERASIQAALIEAVATEIATASPPVRQAA